MGERRFVRDEDGIFCGGCGEVLPGEPDADDVRLHEECERWPHIQNDPTVEWVVLPVR